MVTSFERFYSQLGTNPLILVKTYSFSELCCIGVFRYEVVKSSKFKGLGQLRVLLKRVPIKSYVGGGGRRSLR